MTLELIASGAEASLGLSLGASSAPAISLTRPHHFQEWLNSAVAPDLITLNLQSLEGDETYEYLCSSRSHRTTTAAAGILV
jgi:hypothetical protein